MKFLATLSRIASALGHGLDRIIEPLSPGWASSRASSRLRFHVSRIRRHMVEQFDRAQRGRLSTYEASAKDRTTKDWDSKNKSSDAITVGDYPTLLARTRAAVRDSDVGAAIREGYIRHVVGTGITAKSNARHPETGEPLVVFNRDADALWDVWIREKRFCDVEGRKTFLGLQQLAVGEYIEAGQAFGIHTYEPREDMTGYAVQMFEPEQLDWSLTKAPQSGNDVRGGVEINAVGRPVAFWVYTGAHPLDGSRHKPSQRIPADRVMHMMKQDRVRQTIGVTRYAPVLKDLWHMTMVEEYTVLRARMEACGGASIKRDLDAVETDIGGAKGSTTDPTANDTDARDNKQLVFEPGMVWDPGPGTEIQFHTPQTPGGTYDPYMIRQTTRAAAGAGLNYQTVSQDFKGATFSGQRQALLELWLGIDPEQLKLINEWCRPIRANFIRYSILEGRLDAPNFERPAWRAAYLDAMWQPQAKQWIDPAKQAAALKIMLDLKLTTRKRILNELGEDFGETMREISDETKVAAPLKIIFPENVPKGSQPAVAPQEPRPVRQSAEPLMTDRELKHALIMSLGKTAGQRNGK